jgi:catechol 2,3-dioxygenase-like lactoylglutathione lyase family enzyme
MQITRLDHLTLTVPDVANAAAEYSLLLGQTPQKQALHDMRLACDNIGLVLQPSGEARVADRAAALPLGLMFAADDLSEAARRLARRGLPGEIRAGALHLDPEVTYGVGIGVVAQAPRGDCSDCDIVGLDHVVVRTPDAERAVALYGGRLGLDLRLDRVRAEIGVRQMFFVLGGLVVEVVQSLKDDTRTGLDSVWGLAWRSRDIAASQARLRAAGVNVGEVRDGRKAGTRVATVKSHTGGVPTLLIGGPGLERD